MKSGVMSSNPRELCLSWHSKTKDGISIGTVGLEKELSAQVLMCTKSTKGLKSFGTLITDLTDRIQNSWF